MEGVPAADLAAWKKRQAEESGVPNPDEQRPKKPRFAQVALTPADAKAQLAAHRALMGLVPAAVAPVAAPSPFGVPPPVQNGFPVAPTPIPGMPGLAFLSFFRALGVLTSIALYSLPPPPPGFIPPPGLAFPPPGFPMPPGCVSHSLQSEFGVKTAD